MLVMNEDESDMEEAEIKDGGKKNDDDGDKI